MRKSHTNLQDSIDTENVYQRMLKLEESDCESVQSSDESSQASYNDEDYYDEYDIQSDESENEQLNSSDIFPIECLQDGEWETEKDKEDEDEKKDKEDKSDNPEKEDMEKDDPFKDPNSIYDQLEQEGKKDELDIDVINNRA